MSYITEMVLFACINEDDAIGRLNEWCAQHDEARGQQFGRLDTDAAGGFKFFCDEVWAMAGNYFPWEGLVEALPSFGWECPEDVVLIVDHEGNDGTQVYRVNSDGERRG